MWLLSTDRAELRFVSGPEEVEPEGGYAILSHAWGTQEQTFDDVERIIARCKLKKARLLEERLPRALSRRLGSTNPRDYVSEKIRQSCMIAEKGGYKWIWNDTCCIDKRSSSELSEAINSMYHYYSSAKVCFVYLADVKALNPADRSTPTFEESRWHKRGWTLQELIAPRNIIFLSESWTPLGTKSSLVDRLHIATGIPPSVLKHEPQAMTRLSVAQRLSWMAGRTTHRVEDLAYGLLGIFNINMVTLYGEGDRAFVRLQEKIIKTSSDTSVFAWGAHVDWTALCDVKLEAFQPIGHENSDRYLVSAFHGVFRHSGQILFRRPLPAEMLSETQAPSRTILHPDTIETQSLQRVPSHHHSLPTFSMTQHGLLCRIPVFHTSSFTIAALCCFDEQQGVHLGLILTRCPEQSKSSPGPFYYPGWTPPNGLSVRIVRLGGDSGALQFNGNPVSFAWENIYIALRPPPRDPGTVFGGFRLPRPIIIALTERGWEHIPNTKAPPGWKTPHNFDLLFRREGPGSSHLIFAMGRCSPSEGSPRHWASFWLIPKEPPDDYLPPIHHCPDDHVSEWPDMRKLFTERHSMDALPFAVAFSKSTIPSDSTLVLRVAEGKPGRVRSGDSWFTRDEPHHITPWTLPVTVPPADYRSPRLDSYTAT